MAGGADVEVPTLLNLIIVLDEVHLGSRFTKVDVVEPPNLMPHRSACLPLDTKHSKENTKLLGPVRHTSRENLKIHIFPSGSQMRE